MADEYRYTVYALALILAFFALLFLIGFQLRRRSAAKISAQVAAQAAAVGRAISDAMAAQALAEGAFHFTQDQLFKVLEQRVERALHESSHAVPKNLRELIRKAL